MAKKKTEIIPVFKSWEEANQALREISEINRSLNKIEADLNDAIDQLKAKASADHSPLAARKTELEKHIQQFTESRIEEFQDSKTKNLTFGDVGFRKTKNIIIRNAKAIIEAIKQNRMQSCLKITVNIDKDELAKYDDASLQRVGARRVIKDNYFYKPKVERIEKK